MKVKTLLLNGLAGGAGAAAGWYVSESLIYPAIGPKIAPDHTAMFGVGSSGNTGSLPQFQGSTWDWYDGVTILLMGVGATLGVLLVHKAGI